jgi:phenylacetic acid degradation operon negative regulatory protein
MGKIPRQALKKEFLALTEDLFGRSVDAMIMVLAYLAALSVPKPQSTGLLQSQIAAEKFLQDVNYEVIKNALITASKSGFIKRRRHAMPSITEAGRARLASVIPRHDDTRTWDGRLHIVTYDIPEKQKNVRDLFRVHLRRIGCAKLQESVWLTPYNPIDILREFTADYHIGGTVIVSDLGVDASIGEEDIKTLIVRLYHLEEINARYIKWLDTYGDGDFTTIGYEGVVGYLAILKHDPQLPFALLPKWWKGEKEHAVMKPFLNKLLLDSRPRT